MATLSVEARNAALTAVILLLETGGTQARPSFVSRNGAAAALHNTFFAVTSPSPGPTFDTPSGGVANKAVLPWNMTITSGAPAMTQLATWELRSQLAVAQITGTYGGPGSGADIELDDANLNVGNSSTIRILTFALAIA